MSRIFGVVQLGPKRDARIPDRQLEILGGATGKGTRGTCRAVNLGNAAFGQVVEPITPESLLGEHPLQTADERFVVVADSRLDNRLEVGRALGLSPAELGALPDSRLILLAFEKWGKRCPDYFRGDFTFAIWDAERRELFCARDHIGFRSLFYHLTSTRLVFCGQIEGILRFPGFPVEIDPAYLARYLHVPVPSGLASGGHVYKELRKLNGGRSLTLDVSRASEGRGVQVERYWSPEPIRPVRCADDREYAERLRELLTTSVHNRIRSLPHIGIGVTLSGGLDSSAVACIAARKLQEEGRPLVAVSSVLSVDHQGVENDERAYVDAVLAQEENIRGFPVVAPGAPFDELDDAFAEGHALPKPYHYVDRALWKCAAEQGVRLLLTGEGGDHLASYDGRDVLALLVRSGRLSKALRLAREWAREKNESLWKTSRRSILNPLAPSALVYWYNRLGGLEVRGGSAAENVVNTAAAARFVARFGIRERDIARASYHRELFPGVMADKLRAGRFLVESERRRVGFHGMESLYPFLDKDLMEFCLGVPPEQFMVEGQPRSLFRRAMFGLLPEVVRRRAGKTPYAPDFHRRVLDRREDCLRLLDSVSPDDPVCGIVDVGRIREQLSFARPASGRGDWHRQTRGVVVKGVLVIEFLRWLEEGKTSLLARK